MSWEITHLPPSPNEDVIYPHFIDGSLNWWSCLHFTDNTTEAEGDEISEFELRPTDLPLHPSSPGEDSWSGVCGENWEYQTFAYCLGCFKLL